MTSLINFDAFSHGQIDSKLWLCDLLEPQLKSNCKIAIAGSWYNLLSLLMLSRRSHGYQLIRGIDIDSEAVKVADKICNAWTMRENRIVDNCVADAGTFDYTDFDCVINCSVEHMASDWFSQVAPDTLVCIQSSDVIDPEYPWLITNPNPDMETLVKKYPLSQTLYQGEKEINYGSWGYKRFMIIGKR
jgi:hypothetical protein